MKKVCEDCTHNNYCGGEYVDEKGCFCKHYYNKDGKYVMSAEEKEEKEMGVKFDHYIKNVGTINIEFLPDDSQVKLQVRSGEDIHLFLLEGKGVKIVADRYTELKAENFRLYKEQDKLLEKIELLQERKDLLIKNNGLEKKRLEESDISLQQALKEINELKDLNAKLKQDNHDLISERNSFAAEKHRLKKEQDNLFDKHNVLVLEHDSLLEKYKEQEAKIADLQIEKARLEHEKKDLEQIKENLAQENKNLIHKLGVREAAYQTLKEEFNSLSKSLDAKNWGQCDRFKTLTEENKKLKERNKNLNQQIDKIVLDSYNSFHVRLHGMDFTMDELVDRILELEKLKTPTIENSTDEEPHSRRDILRCAEKCVCGQREQDYGTPESNFKLIADLWNDYLGLAENGDGVPIFSIKNISPMDVAMMMALLKIARIRNGGGTGDSFVDLAGYAACGGEINAQKKATETN